MSTFYLFSEGLQLINILIKGTEIEDKAKECKLNNYCVSSSRDSCTSMQVNDYWNRFKACHKDKKVYIRILNSHMIT